MPNVFKGTADQIESNVNKVQEINETATEEQYPSARAVQNIVGDITELLEYIVDGGDTPPHIGAQIITWEEHD